MPIVTGATPFKPRAQMQRVDMATLPAPGVPAQHAQAPMHPIMAWPTGVIYHPTFHAHVPLGAVCKRGRSPSLRLRGHWLRTLLPQSHPRPEVHLRSHVAAAAASPAARFARCASILSHGVGGGISPPNVRRRECQSVPSVSTATECSSLRPAAPPYERDHPLGQHDYFRVRDDGDQRDDGRLELVRKNEKRGSATPVLMCARRSHVAGKLSQCKSKMSESRLLLEGLRRSMEMAPTQLPFAPF